ncbi:MAG: protein kinase [Isosphaeraceae bacterium]
MSHSTESRSGLVLELAEEFLDRYRNGQRPPLKEYTDRHPELASEIRDVFPAMALMENIAIADDSLHGDETGEAKPLHAPPLERLGDYRIIREVGRGGMGVVYEAEQVSLGRHVALKVLPSQYLRDPRTRLRFEREAKAAARVHHTNIVPVFGVGEHAGTPYYVMQFIRGLGLDGVLDELRRLRARPGQAPGPGHPAYTPRDATAADLARSLLTGRLEALGGARLDLDGAQPTDELDNVPPTLAGTEAPLPAPPAAEPAGSSLSLLAQDPPESRSSRPGRPSYWRSVARIGHQVADALAHAHALGVVHRDIKPSNLLLDARGTAWVTDFGLAKADDQEDLTDTGDVLGTLRYMPPEAFGGRADHRGDVYSLGLTLYELLAFRPAFGERDRGRLIRQVTTEEPPRLRSLNPEVPRDLETVVHKAIERDPGHRYSTAAELAADLQRFLDDEPIRARQISAAERLVRWARRHRAVAALLAALAAVLSGGLAGMTALWLRAERSAVVARDNATRADFLARAETRERQTAQEQTRVATEQTRVATERAEDLAWQDYINRVNRAVVELERDNVALAEDLLLGCPIERRGWEWHYVNRRCHSERLMLAVGSSSVNAVAYSPDGRRIVSAASRGIVGGVSGSHDRRIEIWDRASGRRERLINGSDNLATSLAFSPDGARLAIGGLSPQVEVRDAAAGNVLWSHTPRGRRSSMALAFSPDGTMLAVGHGEYSQVMANPVVFYRADTGEELFTLDGPLGGNNDLAFHPDGKRLAVAGKDAVEIWDVTTRRRLKRLPGHTKWVYAVAYSPDGKILATGGWDRSVKLRDAETGDERLSLFGHEGFVMDLAFSPDGREIASVSEDRSVRLWEVASGHALGAFHGHTDFVFAVAFSPDGREIATGGFDATLRVWDRKASLPVAFTGHRGWVSRFGFRADGRRLASVGSPGPSLAASEIRIWDPATGELEAAPDIAQVETLQPVYPGLKQVGSAKRGMMGTPATVSPDGKRIARVLSRPGTRPGYSDRSGPQEGPGGRAAGYLNNAVEILDAADGRVLHRLIGHTADVMDFAFSPDSSRLATASFDRTLKLWDVPTGREVFTLWGHTAGVVCLAFSPDGHRLASGGIDNTARVWDARPLPADLLAAQEARYRQRQRDLVPPPRTHSEIQWAETLESLGLADQAAAVRARIAASVPDDVKLLTGLAMRLREEGDLDGIRRLADAAQERFGAREDYETLWELAQLNLVAGREERGGPPPSVKRPGPPRRPPRSCHAGREPLHDRRPRGVRQAGRRHRQ